MAKALYRKYRSKTFEEVLGQEHVTKTLVNAIKNGAISHAYLLSGPRGVGKTSVARIIAHEVNGLPYIDGAQHIDIIEIDAASNRRIDEIRDLRDKVHIAPALAKYKVYIIDEVHMLTREAFNALLKTLEEPPAHTIFILATTEPHKLPETIISRTQRFSFKPVDIKTATQYLSELAKKEGIKASEEALELIAEHGQGSFRDSISLLDQLSSQNKKIDVQEVRSMLGLPSEKTVSQLIKLIDDSSTSLIINYLQDLRIQGINAGTLSQELAKQLRIKVVEEEFKPWMPILLRELLAVSSSSQPDAALEIALLEAVAQRYQDENNTNENLIKKNKPKTVSLKTATLTSIESKPLLNKDIFYERDWPTILGIAKEKAASLYTALRLSKPQLLNNVLVLEFQFELHKNKLSGSKHKAILNEIVQEVTGIDIVVDCVLSKRISKESKQQEAMVDKHASDEQLQTISSIFGSSEILEP